MSLMAVDPTTHEWFDLQQMEAERDHDELRRAFKILGPILARNWNQNGADGRGVLELMRKVVLEIDPSLVPARVPPRRRPLPQSTRTRIMERDAYRCRQCGSHYRLHVDHIVAVANGGADDDENLQTLCEPCNLTKGAS